MPTTVLGILYSWGCIGFISPVKALFGEGIQRGSCNSLTLIHIHSNPGNGLNMLSMS